MFCAAARIGEGATGDVFRGELDGAAVAVKRLKMRASADPAERAELELRFRAELNALSCYAHPRVVRLKAFAIAEDHCSTTGPAGGAAATVDYPFALVFDYLDGGSLRDWLRSAGANSAEPLRVLRGGRQFGALERVDVALGAAAGLRFLHGLREPGLEGAPVATVLHRDVKSANIGIALRPDGSMYAKLLDCGLAKAVRGNQAAGAAVSVSGATAGTPGCVNSHATLCGATSTPTAPLCSYMAPEIYRGTYTVASEVYSFGAVLLELLTGARVGPATADDVAYEADDAGGSPAALAARAAGVWPPEAAALLAALIIACLKQRAPLRPVSVAAVIERLHAIRAAVSAAAAVAVLSLELCPVCLEGVPAAAIVRCRAAPPAPVHTCCE